MRTLLPFIAGDVGCKRAPIILAQDAAVPGITDDMHGLPNGAFCLGVCEAPLEVVERIAATLQVSRRTAALPTLANTVPSAVRGDCPGQAALRLKPLAHARTIAREESEIPLVNRTVLPKSLLRVKADGSC